MRTFYDAVTPSNIPANAQGVCGYIDGRYAWHANDWARFPNAVKVRIAVFSSTNDGHVLDIEPGCSTPASAPGWVQRRRAAGVDPSVYCNTSTLPTVQAAFRAAGVPEPHYWIASYPGIGPHLYPGSVAHQYADPGPYDISVVADYWPGVDGTSGGAGGIVSGGVHIPGTPTFPTNSPAPQEDHMSAAQVETLTALTQQVLDAVQGEGVNLDDIPPLYAQLLGRVCKPPEAQYWFITALGTGMSLRQVRNQIAAQVEALTWAITSGYSVFCGRPAQPNEVADWLKTGTAFDAILVAIATSAEAKAHAAAKK